LVEIKKATKVHTAFGVRGPSWPFRSYFYLLPAIDSVGGLPMGLVLNFGNDTDESHALKKATKTGRFCMPPAFVA
jgi:hypothetical protein